MKLAPGNTAPSPDFCAYITIYKCEAVFIESDLVLVPRERVLCVLARTAELFGAKIAAGVQPLHRRLQVLG